MQSPFFFFRCLGLHSEIELQEDFLEIKGGSTSKRKKKKEAMAAPAPIIFLVGFVVTCVGWLLHLIGMATPSWAYLEDMKMDGLFRACDDSGENCETIDLDKAGDKEDPARAVQAMVIIGILLAIAAIIVGIIHIVMGFLGKEPMKVLPLVAGVLSIAAFIFVIIGIIIYGADIFDDLSDSNDDWKLGYSFALSLVGAILLLIGGIIMLVGNVTSVGAA